MTKYLITDIAPIVWEALKAGEIKPTAECVTNASNYEAVLFVGAAHGQIYATIFPKAFRKEVVAIVDKSIEYLERIRNSIGADAEAQEKFDQIESQFARMADLFETVEVGAVNSPFELNGLPMFYSY